MVEREPGIGEGGRERAARTSARAPVLRTSEPLTQAPTMSASAPGSRTRPISAKVKPNPYPDAAGRLAICGITTPAMKRANPIANAARFALHAGRRAMSRISTSGAETRRSTATNPERTVAETTIRITNRAEPHPQALPWEIASRPVPSAAASSRPPAQSGRTDSRTGVSGTSTKTARNRPTATANMNQNTASTEKVSTSTPPSSRPMAAPVPAAATSIPINTGARSGLTRSRANPIAKGPERRPFLAPRGRRPALSSIRPGRRRGNDGMRRRGEHEATLPYMSARRPTIGAAVTAARRKPVTSQVAAVSEAL